MHLLWTSKIIGLMMVALFRHCHIKNWSRRVTLVKHRLLKAISVCIIVLVRVVKMLTMVAFRKRGWVVINLLAALLRIVVVWFNISATVKIIRRFPVVWHSHGELGGRLFLLLIVLLNELGLVLRLILHALGSELLAVHAELSLKETHVGVIFYFCIKRASSFGKDFVSFAF